jgi:glycosyltransferase 2 family protein
MEFPGRTKNLLISCVKIGASMALLYALASTADMAAIGENIIRLPPASAAWCLALFMAITILAGVRWHLIMRAMNVELDQRSVQSLMFIGTFFSQVLPTSVGGDFIRIWHVWRTGARRQDAVISVVAERLNGLIALVFMIAIGIGLMGEQITNSLLRNTLLAMLPLSLAGLIFLGALDRLPVFFRRWTFNKLDGLAAVMRKVFLAWPLAAQLFGISLLGHFLSSLGLFALAQGLGASLSLWQCLGLLPAVILITLVPLSFAGWGIREGAMVVMLGYAGVSPVMALSLSVLLGVGLLAASLPGLLLWLLGWPRVGKPGR